MRNEKIHGWFDSGLIPEALLGHGEFFIRDVSLRTDHDQTAVISQLLDWADTEGRQETAARGILIAIRRAANAEDVRGALGVLSAYQIMSDLTNRTLPLDMNGIVAAAVAVIRRNAREVSTDADLRYFVVNMIKAIPSLGAEIGLDHVERGDSPDRKAGQV